ncbi:MAG: OmpA family protein [Pseudomonadota bacterium]
MPKKEKSGGAPAWMATFSDLCTLLLTFFIIMLSMSTIDVEKYREMLGSISQAFGVQLEQHGNYQAVMPKDLTVQLDPGEGPWKEKEADLVDDAEEQSPAQKKEEQLKEQEKKERQEAVKEIEGAINQTQLGDLAEVMSGAHGIRIRVKGTLLFDAGSAVLKEEAKPFLDSLVQVLEKFEYFLLVEGHTDSTPIASAQFPSNWELSSFRAAAVLRYLMTWGVPADKLTSVGMADNFPLGDNSTAEGRAKNRRVEFVLTKKSFRPEIE